MIGFSESVGKNVTDSMLPAVVLQAGVAKDVISESITNSSDEIVSIAIFNASVANNVYFAYGMDCDNVNNFKGYLTPGEMLNVPTRQRVSCFCAGAGLIARTVLKRNQALGNKIG